MHRVNSIFEKYASIDKMDLSKDGIGDYVDSLTERSYMFFSLGYRHGEIDAIKPLHEIEGNDE